MVGSITLDCDCCCCSLRRGFCSGSNRKTARTRGDPTDDCNFWWGFLDRFGHQYLDGHVHSTETTNLKHNKTNSCCLPRKCVCLSCQKVGKICRFVFAGDKSNRARAGGGRGVGVPGPRPGQSGPRPALGHVRQTLDHQAHVPTQTPHASPRHQADPYLTKLISRQGRPALYR